MKKLLAILLSALLLCAMVPFTAVAAEEYDVPTMVASTVDTADAGEEIQIEVLLVNNPGVIAVAAEVVYDKSVMELVTYYDEDEEMWMPQIEVGATFSASSNKYITFGPIDEETGVAEKCSAFYSRGTAKSDCTKELFYTATFKIKDDAVSGTYPLTITFKPKSAANLAKEFIEFEVATTYITINGTEPPASCEHDYDNACDADCNLCGETREVAGHSYNGEETQAPTCSDAGVMTYTCANCGDSYTEEIAATCATNAVYHEGVEAGCHYQGQNAYWYCANCDVYYANAECTQITNYLSTIIPALQDSAEYIPAKTPTCTENGNVEYWYCADCQQVWADEALTQLTNIKNVQIAPSCKYGAVYNAAKDATCYEEGNSEYWYCATCDMYYADADCTVITNAKNVIIPVSHNVIYVAAVEPTCTAMGNIEHWYCADCGQAWLDELCRFNTNLLAVKLPAAGHSYTNAHDASCDVCGAEREIVLNSAEIILFGGNSVTEERDGLGFKFDVAVDGITFDKEYVADYSNATVTIDGVEYKLVGMGAVANNKGYANQTLADVDGTYVLNVEAVKAFEDADGTHFAVRIVNIPEEHLDTVITVRSYYVYENAGEQIVVYGEDIATSYNAELG